MGSWGLGVYDNDDALDWTHELEARGFGAIVEAFEHAASDDYLERNVVCAAVAAADVVARLRNGDDAEEGYAHTASTWAVKHRSEHWAPLVRPAVGIVDRVMRVENNESYELWQDADELDAWLAVVQSVRDRLTA